MWMLKAKINKKDIQCIAHLVTESYAFAAHAQKLQALKFLPLVMCNILNSKNEN
jgi:hypothetical protein